MYLYMIPAGIAFAASVILLLVKLCHFKKISQQLSPDLKAKRKEARLALKLLSVVKNYTEAIFVVQRMINERCGTMFLIHKLISTCFKSLRGVFLALIINFALCN